MFPSKLGALQGSPFKLDDANSASSPRPFLGLGLGKSWFSAGVPKGVSRGISSSAPRTTISQDCTDGQKLHSQRLCALGGPRWGGEEERDLKVDNKTAKDAAATGRTKRQRGAPVTQARERAAMIRKLRQCPDCRLRRVACQPSHHNMTWMEMTRKFRRFCRSNEAIKFKSFGTLFHGGDSRPEVSVDSDSPIPPEELRLGVQQPGNDDNDDFCSSCGGAGRLICCDGCSRSFHHLCVDARLRFQNAMSEVWFCKVCRDWRESNGLDGRNWSLGPEGDNVWDTLPTTLTPKPQASLASVPSLRLETESEGAATSSFCFPGFDTADESPPTGVDDAIPAGAERAC